ncbi:hypothetical protein A9Q83_13580 [Alphaproteobacteria bacterium 46_93_T64]|nr:hypothetical protein A9Q83_13580 [Alphaproteobacteria bacterium 46_93_T64]
MATLALSVAGAGLGSYTGIGASAGWMAGSTLGKLLFQDNQKAGSSLTDLKFSGASYGAIIPTLFGTMRLGGNIIWCGSLIKENNAAESAGKGGTANASGSSGQSYYANFAIAFSAGAVDDLLRIWADGTLIYDAQSSAEKRSVDLRFRFYNGDENQNPDSIMEAELGVGNVPAYRGVCYLVFDNLALTGYGNRLPNIEVLVTRKAMSNYPQKSGDSYPINSDQVVHDPIRNVIYSYEVMGATDVLRKVDMESLSVIQEAAVGPVFPELPNASVGLCLDRAGDLWVGTGYAMLPSRKIHRFSTALMALEVTQSLPSGIGAITYSVDIQERITGTKFQVAGSQQSGQVVVFNAHLEVVECIDTNSPACAGVIRDEFENAWVIMTGLSSIKPFEDLEIIRISASMSQSIEGGKYQGSFNSYTVPAVELTPVGSGAVNCVTSLVTYLSAQQELILLNSHRILKFSLIRGEITCFRDYGVGNYKILENTSDGDAFVVLENNRWLIYLSTDDLTEIDRVDLLLFSGVSDFSLGAYDARTDSILILPNGEPIRRLYLRRKSGEGASFSEIVLSLTEVAGLDGSDVDVSGLEGGVEGYALNRPMSIQDAIEPLLLAGHFNLSESGYILKFKSLDQGPVCEISAEDLMQPAGQGRIQESELPGSVALSYLDADRGYQIGTQTAKRSYSPHATMYGRNETSITLPMALSSQTAKTICVQGVYDAWAERMIQSIRLPIKYLALDAADMIAVSDAGSVYHGRINQTYLAPDLSLDTETVGAEKLTSSLDVIADTGNGYIEAEVSRSTHCKMHLLDIPLLRDEDATGGAVSRYYFGVSDYDGRWNSAALFLSDAGDRYEQIGFSDEDAGWGVAANALPDVECPWQTDNENKLVIRFMSGNERLETITHLEMLNGRNVLLLGNEIIQFSSVEFLDDGCCELSGLLRGRRGTEWACSLHKLGDRVVLLETGRISSAVNALANLNIIRRWKAVSAGQLIEEVMPELHSLGGTDLKPYAPVHVEATRTAGDLHVTWIRRSRMSGSGLASLAPLSENSERYELEFEYEGMRVSKYVQGNTAYSYERSEFHSDFGETEIDIPSLKLSVFQLSEAVGRGYPAEEMV